MNADPTAPESKRSPALPPETPMDTGSQALSEALKSSFGIIKLVMVLLVFVFLGSGFFTVGPQERAIILRFGKPVGSGEQALLGPGLHLSFPYPIDDHVKVSITGIQKVTSTAAWFATTDQMEAAGIEPGAGATLNPAQDGYAITADGNIVHSRATLTYRINDPVGYIFNFVTAPKAIQDALDNALLFAAAHYNVDDILTRDVIGFRDAVRKRVVELVNQQNLGIIVEQCPVQSIPPRQLRDAFNEVLKAELARNNALNDARTYANQVLSRAGADSQSRTNIAESDRARLVNEISSRAQQFRDLLPKYQANPKLFVQQRLTETLGRVFTNVQDKILVPESGDGNTVELRYNFNRELPKPRTDDANRPPGSP